MSGKKTIVKAVVAMVCTCGGSGWAKCPTCQGKKYVPNGSNVSPRNKHCPD